ncbi:unnamed protein product [Rotaria magnacalcarata]
MQHARENHATVVLTNGNVLVIGGWNGSSNMNAVESYNSTTGTWATINNLVYERSGFTATLLRNGKVLVCDRLDTLLQDTVELYDPSTGLWTSTVLVAGESNIINSLNTSELYDPSTGTWDMIGSMTDARQLHTATFLTYLKVLITSGGLNSTELYDSSNGTWSITSSMNVPRSEHAAVAFLNGIVLVAGGIRVTDENTAELYRLLGTNQ